MSVQKGNIAELEFTLQALRRNLAVSSPILETTHDLLLETSTRTYKIQVKSTFTKRLWCKTSGYSISLSNKNGSYSPNDVDIIAGYIDEINTWYLFPIWAVKGIKRVTLIPFSEFSKWNNYKETWEVFK